MNPQLFSLVMVALFPVASLAYQSQVVQLSAKNPIQVVQITDQKFEPFYEDRPYETTCDREVADHTETTCSDVPRESCSGGGQVCETENDTVCNSQGCTTVPRRSCHTESQSCTTTTSRECSNHTVYRTETYSCTKYMSVQVGERLVKTFNHSIEVSLENPNAFGDSVLSVSVDAREDEISTHLKKSYVESLLTFNADASSISNSDSVQALKGKLIIHYGIPAAQVKALKDSKMIELAMGRDAFKFNIKNAGAFADYLKISTKLVRTPALWFAHTVYDGSIESSKLSLTAQGEDLAAIVSWSKLGIDSISSNRYSLEVKVTLDRSKFVNDDEFSDVMKKFYSLNLHKERPSF